MAKINGATLIARSLKEQGIDHLFGVVGFPVGPIAEAAQKEGINYVGMRNEQAASYAAQAYGYMTGRPGACIVVTGPGVVHGLAGLANAQQNCWPMILIGGASQIKRENPELDLSEEISILREGQAAGQADFDESIYKYIEQVEVLVNKQTPMGMSAAEGLRVFGIEAGGVLMADSAVGDVRGLIALMGDDNVLSWLDEVDAMKQYGELRR